MAKAVFDAEGNLVAVGRDPVAPETSQDVTLAQVEVDAEPGYGHADPWPWVSSSIIKAGARAEDVAPTAAQITAHTHAVLDLANVSWIWQPSDGLLVENARWINFHYWIGSGHLVVENIRASNLADNIKALAFRTYQTMIPADAALLAFWYRNHAEAVWTAYRAVLGGTETARAHFNFETSDTEPREFASDAVSARAWASTTIPIAWRAP